MILHIDINSISLDSPTGIFCNKCTQAFQVNFGTQGNDIGINCNSVIFLDKITAARYAISFATTDWTSAVGGNCDRQGFFRTVILNPGESILLFGKFLGRR